MRIRFSLFLLLAVLASCAKQPIVPPPQEDVLYQIEDCFAQNPDSVMQILDTLDVTVLSEKERAHYCLLKVWTRDYRYLYDSITDSLLQVAENYFVGGKDKWFEAETCEALSRIAFKEGKGEQIKLDWLLKAYQSIAQCKHLDERFIRYSNREETPKERIDSYRNMIQMRLGMCYLDNDYYKEGLCHLKPVYHYYADNQDERMMACSANMLGNAYLMEAAQKFNQIENIVYYQYSMSMLYLYQFDDQDYETPEEGCQLLQKAIEDCHRGLNLYDETMSKYKDGFYCNLGKCYYRLEQYDSCVYYVEKQIDFMNAMHYEIVPHPENAALFYRLYKSYEALGKEEKALEYANRYFEMQQALENQPKAVEQVKNEYDKKLEMIQLQNEQQAKRYQLYLLLALSFATLFVLLWLTNRYRKNKEIETLRQKEAYRKLQSEFETVSAQVQQARKVTQQRVMELYKTTVVNKLERILAEFEAAYPQGMEKLSANHPNLTETECQIIVLSFLQFRVKEMAELLNLSTNTVVKYRTNIRKKVDSKAISDLI